MALHPPVDSARPNGDSFRLVASSCRAVADRRDLLIAAFSKHLVEIDRANGPRLVADGNAAELLASVVEAAATADPRVAESRWLALGARARLGGYGDDDFVWVGHALVRAVRDLLGDGWSSGLSSAWMAFHVWMARYLSAGAATVDAAEVEAHARRRAVAGPGAGALTGGPGPGARGPATTDPWPAEPIVVPEVRPAGDGGAAWGPDHVAAAMEQGLRKRRFGLSGRRRR